MELQTRLLFEDAELRKATWMLWLLRSSKEFQGVPKFQFFGCWYWNVLFGLFGLYLFGVSFCCSSSIKRTCMIDWWWFSGVVMGNYMCVSGSCGKNHVSTPALEAILFQHAWLPTTWESMTSPNGHEMMSPYALNANNTDWTLMILDQPVLPTSDFCFHSFSTALMDINGISGTKSLAVQFFLKLAVAVTVFCASVPRPWPSI